MRIYDNLNIKQQAPITFTEDNMEKFRVFILIIAVLIMAGCAASNASRKEDAAIHYEVGIVHLNEGNIPDALKELTAAV